MHIGRKFTVYQTVRWTYKYILVFAVLSTTAVLLFEVLDLKWLSIPWLPISLIGIAVAFTIGFKNNSSYDRLWEARKIWGKVVNDSRYWGTLVLDYPTCSKEEQQLLINRHIAWLTAFRFQMRKIKPWEHTDPESQRKRKFFNIEEYRKDINEKILALISEEEWNAIKDTANPAAQLLKNQSAHLKKLHDEDQLDHFHRIEMSKVIHEFFVAQGKSEHIKNFPFPRQYASVSMIFVWMFILLLPFGLMHEFEKLGHDFVWLTIPFCVMVSWAFHTMELIGDYSENPFEGFVNDVPITEISRGIENDLQQMVNRTYETQPGMVEKNIQF